VVGGGITGCSAAWHLAQYGADVLLLEQHDLNTQASGRNAGSLHGQIQHASFVERGEGWARDYLPSLRFLVDSLELWQGLSDSLGIDLEVSLNGGLLVAETDAQMQDIARKVSIERSAGVESEILGPSDLQKFAPYISDQMAGAQLCRIEGKANTLLAAPAFARSASRLGAQITTNTPVHSLEHENGRFVAATDAGLYTSDRVILTTGNAVNRFSHLWGKPLPITDEPVQVGATEAFAPLVHHLVYFAGGKLTFKQARSGTLLIGGGWAADTDSDTGYPRVNPESLVSNMNVAMRVVPSLASVRLIRTWAGVGLATPDLAPIVGQLGPKGLFAGVFPHLGFTAGPLMGKVLAQLALDREPETDLRTFDPDRF
jgi:glycine/D-amino acid oxidase-like deaminating enzyme